MAIVMCFMRRLASTPRSSAIARQPRDRRRLARAPGGHLERPWNSARADPRATSRSGGGTAVAETASTMKKKTIRQLASKMPTLPLAQVRGGNTIPCVGANPCGNVDGNPCGNIYRRKS
jgi:hypothetical protein